MKKLVLLTLMAALAMPAMVANNQAVKKNVNLGDVRTAIGVVNSKPAPKMSTPKRAASDMVSVTLTVGDVWGDGSGYQMLLDADATAYGYYIPETGALTASGDASTDVYDQFEYKIPENADGALATTNIVLNSSVTIEIPAGTYDWCITNPTPGDRMWIASEQGNVGGRQDDYVFEAGHTYEFTVTLSGSNDAVNVEIIDLGAPEVPVELTVNEESITSSSAEVLWEPGENNDFWNLRFRKYVEPGEEIAADFEYNIPEGWITIDADGDGYTWEYSDQFTAHGGTGLVYSASYINYVGALTPDNWLVSPQVKLGGQISFWACGQDASYAAEHFAVFVTTGDPQDVTGYTQVSEEYVATGNMTEYVVDLSEYSGNGYVAIRHFNVTDMFYLNVDDITITVPGAETPEEWTVVEDLSETSYTIDGLEASTTYEVQVQGGKANPSKAEGDALSAWTESVLFTTDELTAVEAVKVETTGDNNYYNLMGQKVSGTAPGIYIHNGKKVIVR